MASGGRAWPPSWALLQAPSSRIASSSGVRQRKDRKGSRIMVVAWALVGLGWVLAGAALTVQIIAKPPFAPPAEIFPGVTGGESEAPSARAVAAGASASGKMRRAIRRGADDGEATMRRTGNLLLLALLAAPMPGRAAEAERVSTLGEQRQVAVTIYNEDMALVRDSRRVDLPAGESALAWRDVSARMRPETALLHSLSGGRGFQPIEQNFDFDLLTPQKLLEKYVGRRVRIIRTNPATGADSSEEATVLSANEGVVLQYADRIESHPPGRLAFQAVPDNLRDRPTLVIRLRAAEAGSRDLELTYLTGGLSWKADYVAELSAGDERLDLDGWVTLTNRSGTGYREAQLQLVAGDVNRVRGDLDAARGVQLKAAPAAAREMREESLFEYHLYTLERPTTIADNQTKQVALLSAGQVPARKQFQLRGADYYYRSGVGEIGQKLKVGVFVEFDNKGRDLGVPLPKGIVRVYKKDAGGNAQFVGEDRIDHTPKNETVRLHLGDAFDVTADKKQTVFQKLSGNGRYNYVFEAAFEIVLKNAKREAVSVQVVEPIPGDWEMVSESLRHTRAAANTALWSVAVPAESTATLAYRVRVRY